MLRVAVGLIFSRAHQPAPPMVKSLLTSIVMTAFAFVSVDALSSSDIIASKLPCLVVVCPSFVTVIVTCSVESVNASAAFTASTVAKTSTMSIRQTKNDFSFMFISYLHFYNIYIFEILNRKVIIA